MKILSWCAGIVFAAAVLLFALSNRQTVTLGLWPFEEGLAMPAYAAVLISLLAGVVVGLLLSGRATLRHRRQARRQARRADTLERELKTVKDGEATATPSPPSAAAKS